MNMDCNSKEECRSLNEEHVSHVQIYKRSPTGRCRSTMKAFRHIFVTVLVCSIIALVIIVSLMKSKLDSVAKENENLQKLEINDELVNRASDFTDYGDPDQPRTLRLAALAGLAKGAASKIGPITSVLSAISRGKNLSSSKKSSDPNPRQQEQSDDNNPVNTALELLRARKKESQKSRISVEDRLPDGAYSKLHLELGYDNEIKLNCQGLEPKNTFPNVDYAFLGYDIYKGFPLSNGHDPGFTYSIFEADYTSGLQTDDCRFNTPKGLATITDVSCLTAFSNEVYSNEIELETDFHIYSRSKAGFFGVDFHGSAEYRKAWSLLSSGEYIYLVSAAQCSYYSTKIQTEELPPFRQIFLEWIEKLNNTKDNTTFITFLSKFGTHFIKEMTFGARFSYQYTMKRQEWELLVSQGFDVSSGLSVGEFYKINAGSGNDKLESAKRLAKLEASRTVSVGIAPPSDGNGQTWATKVQENPMPISYKLEPIEALFQADYMKDFDIDLERIFKLISTLKAEYHDQLLEEVAKGEYYASGRWITKTLSVSNGGTEGEWHPPEFCPLGYFAVGYKMKIEHYMTNKDNTALNALNLICANHDGDLIPNHRGIQSGVGHRGLWTSSAICPKINGNILFLQEFNQYTQKEDPNKRKPDNMSINFVAFKCNNMQQSLSPAQPRIDVPQLGADSHYGQWSERCPQGSAICGIQTRIDDYHTNNDNTGLNDMKLICCEDESV